MKPVPVMSFHSVGDHGLPGDMRHLTTTPEVLEGALRWLQRNRFATLTQQQLFDHLAHGADIPDRSVVLAFDDGYLDNWTFVHPLLAKFGMRGVIYVTGDFIEAGDELRPTLDQAQLDSPTRARLPGLGYCNHGELRAMAAAGTLEMQSHLMTHSWHPISGKILGFHRPGAMSVWSTWNAARSEKPHWLSWSEGDFGSRLGWGAAVYENIRTHAAPAVTPDPAINEALFACVQADGASQFFARDDWRTALEDAALQAGAQRQDDGIFAPIVAEESVEEFEARFEAECSESRTIIESIAPAPPANFMAWPGGVYTSRLQELALKHYDATFTTDHGVNDPSDDARLIKRSFFNQRGPELMGKTWPSVMHFAGRVRTLRGQSWARGLTGFSHRLLRAAARRKEARR